MDLASQDRSADKDLKQTNDPVKPVPRKPGGGKGIWMAPDFDAPLDDFAAYM